MSNNTTSPLGKLARVINGRAYKQEELLDFGKYRVLRVGNFFSNGSWYYSDLELDEDKYCDSGDLLFAWSASFGPKIWSDEKVIYHYHIWKIVENPQLVDRKFLYYFLLNSVQGMMASTHGSIMLHLTKEYMDRLPIHHSADVNVQKNIAAILSAIDSKIDCNHRIITELESFAKTLHDYWFVQFDFPDLNGKPYKSSGGTMVYNDLLKRPIPDGWGTIELGKIADLYQPKTISEKEMQIDGKYLVYGANGIVGRYDHYNHDKSVVTITCRGNSCGEINITRPFSWITGNAMVVKPIEDHISVDYLFNLLKRSGIHKVITGSAQPQITRTNLSPVLAVSPPKSLLSNYSHIVSESFDKRIAALEENEYLENFRDWLLPFLMNGQVTVNSVNTS